MEKIYGYKEKDVLGLARFIRERKGGTLTEAFSEYASFSGKAQGTVRNLYYALAKKSVTDKEFCQKYLGGEPLTVSKIVEFDQTEERQLIKDVLKQKLGGRSVRSAILEMANGDEKMALRFQNKFRNCLKSNPELIREITLELVGDSNELTLSAGSKAILEIQTRKLKSEINGLVDKISLSIKKENERLKARLAVLERENASLRQELGLKPNADNALRFFFKNDGVSLNS